MRTLRSRWLFVGGLIASTVASTSVTYGQNSPEPPASASESGQSYMPIVFEKTFQQMHDADVAEREKLNQRQAKLLQERYDLKDNPSDVWMAGKRKKVQQGVRVRLPDGMTWDKLGAMTPEEIRQQGVFPGGFRPLPHADHPTGGQVFPKDQIDAMANLEKRNLQRFDIDFDLPDHLTPEFPPPMFLTNRPDLGDVTEGQVLSIKNYYQLLQGKVTPVQMEGMRLLLTPFPQQQFNQTEDRKTVEPELGVTCFDCHVNGHTNATFHLNPDTRPQTIRFRIDTVSLRGLYNQQIHGSKRSLRSVEDFTEFEQRTAYFDGDQVTAAKKGVHLPNRSDQVAMMAQMQNMIDFPPAPKLDLYGKLIPEKATKQELEGEKIFFGKARCGECHPAPFYLDDKMHDLQVGRFYDVQDVNGHTDVAAGAIKTFTLRGIKDSPPYLHDGRLMTLEDTVQFFNVVMQTKLTAEERAALVAFMRCL